MRAYITLQVNQPWDEVQTRVTVVDPLMLVAEAQPSLSDPHAGKPETVWPGNAQ